MKFFFFFAYGGDIFRGLTQLNSEDKNCFNGKKITLKIKSHYFFHFKSYSH